MSSFQDLGFFVPNKAEAQRSSAQEALNYKTEVEHAHFFNHCI